MVFRPTKDLLAVVITVVFLAWVVASAFIPLWYAPAKSVLYQGKGGALVWLDVLAALFCIFAYIAIGRTFPKRRALGPSDLGP